MTTRDPRSREYPTATSAGDGGRESTQSLNLEPGEQPSPAALALGTHNRQVTRIESPNGRGKTPVPPPHPAAMPAGRPDGPDDYLDAVLGSYRVIELLGKGGMGYVYRAEHVKLGREVALKLLRSDYASRRDAVARFFQEARTVNRVRHRNIVDVTDFVELDDGTTYIIMELLTGTSLGAWARTGIDLPRALAVLVQICDGLGAAHEVGVVHRDLKPDNVMVVPTSDGAELVKLLDFGVAKLLNRDDEDVGFQTAAGSVIGTPAYMSPEQAGGMVIDARSDIYSLGAIMYELFCGQPMFRGRSFGEYVRKHLTEMPVPPRQTPGGAGLAPEIEALILRCLDKDPDQRFAHIVELREALLQLLGGTGTELPSLPGTTGSGMRPQRPLPLSSPVGFAPSSGSHMPPMSAVSGASGASVLSGASRISGASGASRISGASRTSGLSGAHPSQVGAQHGYPPPPLPAPASATPWWVWFVGGAGAVGVGIAAALWYAGRDTPELPPRPAPAIALPVQPAAQPTAQPLEPPAARAGLVEVRLDSLPSGGVYAEGRAAELCRTPCTFHIDLADGGATDRRAFVVKRDGYSDGPITVDLTGEQREFRVVLRQVTPPPADRADARQPETRPDKRPTKHPLKPSRRDSAPARDSSARDSSARQPRDTAQDLKNARDPDRDHLLDPTDPTDGKPPARKPPDRPAIDPADTLDPFHKK